MAGHNPTPFTRLAHEEMINPKSESMNNTERRLS